MSTIANILKDCRTSMDKGIEAAKREFGTVRSGKASPNMLDQVKVEMYGSHLPMNQCAQVSAPEPRILMVTPFDKGQIRAVEKAIRESDLGLDPAIQGAVIRVPLPAMNEQRRKDLVKVLHKYAEDGRIAVRHAVTTGTAASTLSVSPSLAHWRNAACVNRPLAHLSPISSQADSAARIALRDFSTIC